MLKQTTVAVTGAAGHIGYALLFRIAAGEMFGKDTRVDLRLLELESALPALQGIVMELDDCALPLLGCVTVTSDPKIAFKGTDFVLLIGSIPRKEGMERGDLLKINAGVFIEQGKALSQAARPTCKILVVGNPCNTNAYIAKTVCKNIPAKNFFAMTMLDQNRAAAQLAQKAGVAVSSVGKVGIWGNHSATQYPDFYHAVINGRPATEVITDKAWLEGAFIATVQKRGAAIIKARGLSSAASAANAVVDTVRNIITPTPAGSFFSAAVASDGSYGIPKGIVFGFPLRSSGQDWEIVQGLNHNDFAKARIKLTLDELLSEKQAVDATL